MRSRIGGRVGGWALGLTGALTLDELWHHAILGTVLGIAAVGSAAAAGWRARSARS